MRSTYRVLAMLIAIGVVLQAAFIAYGTFDVMGDVEGGAVYDENSEYNAGQNLHSVVGTIAIPLVSLALLIVSFFARIPGGVKWAAIVFAVVVLQVVLAFVAFAAPVVGALHGINALVLAGVAGTAARQAGAQSAVPRADPTRKRSVA